MKTHANIPIFIPHLGCPNQCVFCNQRIISGEKEFKPEEIKDKIETALSTINDGREVEIAFFGGSFTGIDRNLMTELLEIGYSYIKSGRVVGIRCSTRPDYIDVEVLEILKKYGVKVIELGLQSIDEEVLRVTKRGHTADDAKRACKLVVDYGFELVGQMMIGLPGSTPEREIETAKFIIDSGAVGARIYPTVVFSDTELCHMAKVGEYNPISLPDAVKRSADVKRLFVSSDISVIRVGLCSSENLSADDTYFAGPNHAAIGELVENEIYYSIISEKMKEINPMPGDNITIFVRKGSLSKALGQKKSNKIRIIKEFNTPYVNFSESEELDEYGVRIYTENRKEKRCT